MFTDERRFEVWEEIRQHGIRAFAKKVTPTVLAQAAARTGVAVVKSPLCAANLVWLAISVALNSGSDFATILTATLKVLEDEEVFYSTPLGKARRKGQQAERQQNGRSEKTRGRSKKTRGRNKNTRGRSRKARGQQKNTRRSKHDPYRHDPTQVTEEAFTKARRRLPFSFWVNLLIILGEQFAAQHQSLLKFRGFRLLALDGTCLNLPNWKALRDHFGTAKNARGQHKAQARMVMLQLPLVRLPYRYELCPLDEGEPTIARRLAQHLQPDDLLLIDACFWSYGLLCDIQNRGAFFAIPLKRKLNLQRTARLGRQDELVRWTPKDSRGQWRKENLPRSMALRIVTYAVPGFRPQKLATNVLCPEKISRDDWRGVAADCTDQGEFRPGLYHRRWEIENSQAECTSRTRLYQLAS